MESDCDVDMSWVELAAGETKAPKRDISPLGVDQQPEAKRLRTSDGRLAVRGDVGQEDENRHLDEVKPAAMDGVVVMDINEGGEVKLTGVDDGVVEKGEDGGGEEIVETEEEKERKRIRAEKQRERDQKTAFWTTPGLRPLAEPPILDWDWFFRTKIPSDLRYKALFPDDPENRAMYKDVEGEVGALGGYFRCMKLMRDDPATDNKRQGFYQKLAVELMEDWVHVFQELQELWATTTDLCRFEFRHLDNDGRTTRLEQWISKGADIFYEWGDEVREKYSHLVPHDFVENPLATFEFSFLDDSGEASRIRANMKEGVDLLKGWPQEVQDKHGHLRRYLPRPPPFRSDTPTSVHSKALAGSGDLSKQTPDSRPDAGRRAST